jgi:hypothetical protein
VIELTVLRVSKKKPWSYGQIAQICGLPTDIYRSIPDPNYIVLFGDWDPPDVFDKLEERALALDHSCIERIPPRIKPLILIRKNGKELKRLK